MEGTSIQVHMLALIMLQLIQTTHHFYRATLCLCGICYGHASVHLSISVTSRHCTKIAKHRIMQTMPHNSSDVTIVIFSSIRFRLNFFYKEFNFDLISDSFFLPQYLELKRDQIRRDINSFTLGVIGLAGCKTHFVKSPAPIISPSRVIRYRIRVTLALKIAISIPFSFPKKSQF